MFPHPGQSKISQEEPLELDKVSGKPDPDKPIYFFESNNLSGRYFILYAGQWVDDLSGTTWDKKISSIFLSPQTKITLWSKNNIVDISNRVPESGNRWTFVNLETIVATLSSVRFNGITIRIDTEGYRGGIGMYRFKYKYKYKYCSEHHVVDDAAEMEVVGEQSQSSFEGDSANIHQNKTIRVEHASGSAVEARVLVFFDFYFEPRKQQMNSVYCTTSGFPVGKAMSLTLPESTSNKVDLHILASVLVGPWHRGKDACSKEGIGLPACFRIGELFGLSNVNLVS